jgi:hypothetical protein
MATDRPPPVEKDGPQRITRPVGQTRRDLAVTAALVARAKEAIARSKRLLLALASRNQGKQ